MTEENSTSWLSAHLYYDEPWERFLTEAVRPYAEIVLNTGIASSFFFIRYWDRGPHIRLRFKAKPEIIEKILRPNLEEHFLNYFDSVPSFRTDPPYPVGIPEDYKWLPNNSVQYEDYSPEVERYGGLIGLNLAEQQFELSSTTVLKSIEKQGEEWSYDDALGTAIKLHLSFLHTLGWEDTVIRAFLRFYFQNWFPHSFSLAPDTLDVSSLQQEKIEMLTQFEDAFEVQKETLVSFHRILWNGLKTGVENFEEVLLQDWVNGNEVILNDLVEAKNNNTLADRPTEQAYHSSEDNLFYSNLWDHYADYIHMTNNRLGIQNKDEGYLAYMMMRSMEVMEESDEEEGISGLNKLRKNSFISLD